jgi:hypothetical protein
VGGVHGDPGRNRAARAAALAVATGALALAAVAVATSLGSSHHVEYFKKQLHVDAASTWKKQTKCDSDQLATGGGAFFTGNYSEAFVTSQYPAKSGHHGWEGRGYNDTGGAGKDVVTYAYCAKKLDLDYVKEKATLGASPATLNQPVACTGARKIAGGGVKVSGPHSEVLLNDFGPVTDASWHATVQNRAGDAKDVTVYAICAKASADIEYIQSTTVDGLDTAPDTFQAGGGCSDATLIGGGIDISGTAANAHIVGLGLTNEDSPGDSLTVRANNDSGSAKDVTFTRICLP